MKILTIIFVISLLNSTKAQEYGSWYIADSLKEARQDAASVVLSDSNILVTGGAYEDNLKSSEIFDAKTEKWKSASPMINGRSYHELIRLDNNKVLAIGGYNNPSCEIYDPLTDTWTLTDSLIYKVVFGSRIIKLKDGNILKTGGIANGPNNSGSIYLNKAEIYDVSIGKWTETDSMKFDRAYHSMTLLLNGSVLVVGGLQKDKSTTERKTLVLKSCEVYNPEIKKWELVDSLEVERYSHSSYLMDNGNVFVSGGRNDGTSWLSSCELYNTELNQWTYVGEMSRARMDHSIMPYDNDNVIIFGGSFGAETWEIYNIRTYNSVYLDNYPVNQIYSTSELLPQRKIINIGGVSWYQNNLFSTDLTLIFDPEYTVGIDGNSLVLPHSVKLFQNYPNPFNPTTVIGFECSITGNVVITVFDVLGRKIKELTNKYYAPGVYEVTFDSKELQSGIYFYQLKTNNFTQSKKMLLIK